MNIEHIALQVEHPARMVAWWCEHLGMKIVRQGGAEAFFVSDEAGRVVLEIYYNPKAPVPAYGEWEAARFHIAFASEDVKADAARLAAAGGRLEGTVEEIAPTETGDVFAIVRDPWGVAVQLVKRGKRLEVRGER